MNAGADGQVCVSLGFSRSVCLGNYQHKEEFCFPAGDFYKMETADVLQSVEIITSSGDWCILSKEREELAYSYRTSPFQKMKHVAAIVAATFQLTPCPNARQRQKLFLDRYLSGQVPSFHFLLCML
jgi:hypothetical protein